MRGKHSPASGSLLTRVLPGDDPRLRRGWAMVGTVLVIAAVAWSMVWVQATTGRDPAARARQPVSPAAVVTVEPVVPLGPPVLSSPSSSRPSSSSSRSASPSRSSSPSRPPSTTRPPTVPARTKAAKPAKTGSLTAGYVVGANWDTGFIASITVVNNTGHDVWPTIHVHNRPEDGVRVNQVWTGSVSRYGDTVVFSNAKLATGDTLTIGFDATKNAGPRALPASCTIDGGTCRVS